MNSLIRGAQGRSNAEIAHTNWIYCRSIGRDVSKTYAYFSAVFLFSLYSYIVISVYRDVAFDTVHNVLYLP